MAGFDPSQSGRSRRSSNRTAAMKIIWTLQLQLIFLDAVMLLGRDNKGDVVPSKVLDVMMNDKRTSDILKGMNVQKLTRQHVASHLQKLRGFLYSKTKRPRMNKLGIWNRDHECIRERHEYIKHSQLLAEPKSGHRSASSKGVPLSTKEQDESIPLMFCQEDNLQSTLQGFSSSYCFTTTSINNNINNVVVGEATMLTIYPAQAAFDDNNVGHLTNNFMNPSFYNNHQEQGNGETLLGYWQPETCVQLLPISESGGYSNYDTPQGINYSGNYDPTMAWFDQANGVAPTPTTYHPIYSPHNNNVGQHFTSNDLIIYNNNNNSNNQQNQGFGETLVAGQPETSQYSILETAGDSNSSLLNDASTAPQEAIFGTYFFGLKLPRLDDINKEFQDLDEWMTH